jgi:hypothetical protein
VIPERGSPYSGEPVVNFDELLSQVLDLLQWDQRVSYHALKRRLGFDDDYLEDIKDELIDAKKLAVLEFWATSLSVVSRCQVGT